MSERNIPDLQLISVIDAEFRAAKAAEEARLAVIRRSAITNARIQILVILRNRLREIRENIGALGDDVTLIDGGARIRIMLHQMPNKDIDGHESFTTMYLVEGGDGQNIASTFQRTYGSELKVQNEEIDGVERVTFFVTY